MLLGGGGRRRKGTWQNLAVTLLKEVLKEKLVTDRLYILVKLKKLKLKI